MTGEEFRSLTGNLVFLDGAMGTNLYRSGMARGVSTEVWALEHPEVVEKLQSEYVEAGAQIIYAPTFGANRNALKGFGKEDEIERLNRGLVRLSRKAAAGRCYVAGDMAPTGLLLEECGGEAEEEELFEIFAEQAKILDDEGVDLIVAETMMSVAEAQIALDAIRSVSSLPVMVSLSVTPGGRCFFGGTAVEGMETLQEKADAVGINCSCGPDQLEQVVRDMKNVARVPLIVKPNAGTPVTDSNGNATYEMGPDEFAMHMKTLVKAGAALVGGCCGTTPAYIRKLKLALEGRLIGSARRG